ncbi:MAG: hypothetical protein M3281_03895, partial [Chloroflexota bacterium]|nr:hypothetical protein [Chloroflexota bacterium]
LCTSEYLDCHAQQLDYVMQHLQPSDSAVVDLASGRGTLARRLLAELRTPVVVTDFSLPVLRRDLRWFRSLGLDERLSLLGFDARRAPFRDGAVRTLVTNLGLPNIESPGELLLELRRVVSGELLAICHFYPEDDGVNGEAIEAAGLGQMLYRDRLLEALADAGWRASVESVCTGRAAPTPEGVLLEGARIDRLPLAPTTLEWCVLVCT